MRAAADAAYPATLAGVFARSSSAYSVGFPSPVGQQMAMVAALPKKLNPADRGATLQPPLVYWLIQFGRLFVSRIGNKVFKSSVSSVLQPENVEAFGKG